MCSGFLVLEDNLQNEVAIDHIPTIDNFFPFTSHPLMKLYFPHSQPM